VQALLVGLGLYIHFRVDDTPAFRQLRQSARVSPIIEALRRHPRLILLAAGAHISTNLSFYILITYVVSYGTSTTGLHLPRCTMLARDSHGVISGTVG
jgi:MHS family shikimate/dehydroshikimate transporter-like MFS transporter